MQPYDVFISYSRRDKAFAARLERELSKVRHPDGPTKGAKLRCYRDETEAATSNYRSAVLEVLSASISLVVVCSPASAASKFVAEEISTFALNHPPDRCAAVLAPGAEETEATFPEALLRVLPRPLASDFRNLDPGKSIYQKPFVFEWFKLLSSILGLPRETVERRERARRIKRALELGAVLSLGLILLSWGGVELWYAAPQYQLQYSIRKGRALFAHEPLGIESGDKWAVALTASGDIDGAIEAAKKYTRGSGPSWVLLQCVEVAHAAERPEDAHRLLDVAATIALSSRDYDAVKQAARIRFAIDVKQHTLEMRDRVALSEDKSGSVPANGVAAEPPRSLDSPVSPAIAIAKADDGDRRLVLEGLLRSFRDGLTGAESASDPEWLGLTVQAKQLNAVDEVASMLTAVASEPTRDYQHLFGCATALQALGKLEDARRIVLRSLNDLLTGGPRTGLLPWKPVATKVSEVAAKLEVTDADVQALSGLSELSHYDGPTYALIFAHQGWTGVADSIVRAHVLSLPPDELGLEDVCALSAVGRFRTAREAADRLDSSQKVDGFSAVIAAVSLRDRFAARNLAENHICN